MRLASVIVKSGDQEEYASFCQRMVDRFGDATDPTVIERTLKSCLLMPDAIDLSKLPIDAFERAFKTNTIAERYLAYAWGARGLVALRQGNPAFR